MDKKPKAKPKRKRLKNFHFDFGDSNDGPIGGCARVLAYTKKEAVQKLKDAMPDEIEARSFCVSGGEVEYLNVYFNAENINTGHIDDVEDVEGQ